MSEFEGFDNNFEEGNFAEVDPAAEFLAREQDELAGLEDDDGFANVNSTNHIDHHEEVTESFMDEMPEPYVNGLPESQQMPSAPSKPIVREEPEKIRKWREEQQLRLEQKDAEEENKKEELRQTAKHELEEWYRHHKEQVEKTQQQNREASKNAEKEYVMERDSEAEGQEWERIAKLCDFNPKTSKNTKDISRMRSIILQLKQNPINHRS